MRKLFERTVIAAALFIALPLAVSAQEEEAQEAACVAEVNPVKVGQIAEVWGTFATAFGEVTAIQAPAESGLTLASSEDIERVEMAAEEDPEKAALANLDTTSIFWLDTREATVGTYTVTLEGEGGSCTAEITVEESN